MQELLPRTDLLLLIIIVEVEALMVDMDER